MVRRFFPFLLLSLVIAMLAACGDTLPPDPDLALTGVTPAVALPGASVTLQGTGFEAGQAVTFDGVAVTVTNVTATSITVTVPDTYGYPTIAVEDVAEDELLFVGTVYAGAQNLDAVQAALDDLPENGALRLPAGAYATPGTSLDLDNRKLYGAGPTTVLDAPDGLDLYARSANATVVQDLSVTGGGDVYVNRGRIPTASLPPAGTYGRVVFQDVDLTVGAFAADDDYLHVRIAGATIDAASFDAGAYSSVIEIENATLTLTGDFYADHYGGLTVRDTAIEAGGQIYVYVDYVIGITFERSTLDAGTSVYVYSYDPVVTTELAFRDTEVVAGSYVYIGSSGAPMVFEDVTITAADYVDIDADDYGATVTMTDTTVDAGSSIDLGDGYAGIFVARSSLRAATYIDVDAYGPVSFVDSTLDADTEYVYVDSDYSDLISFVGSTAAAGTYVEFYAYGPVSVVGGSLDAGGYIQLTSSYAGEIAVRDTTSIAAGAYFGFYDSGNAYAGNNGTFVFENNAATALGTYFELSSAYSDVVVRGNGPIEAAGIVNLIGSFSHVTAADNERIQSGGDITLFSANPGGRIVATDNTFVANAGVGTITLETQAGELTQSGNVFTGTLATPNN